MNESVSPPLTERKLREWRML